MRRGAEVSPTTGTAVDVVIVLDQPDGTPWTSAEVRVEVPGGDSDIRSSWQGIMPGLEGLTAASLDPGVHGRELGRWLFGIPELNETLRGARSQDEARQVPLRVRLAIGAGPGLLQDARWETLRDPDDDSPLLTSERVLFSRYLSSKDWRPVEERANRHLRALVVVANPSDLGTWRMPAIDVPAEVARARDGLGGAQVTVLGEESPATLQAVVDELRRGHEILYVVCHGFMSGNEPQLLLESDVRRAVRVSGTALAVRIGEISELPRLVVLASCGSAGPDDDKPAGQERVLTGLGPRLAEAGVPAVLAMYGDLSMATNAVFMPRFFGELRLHGEIDRAAAIARAAVRERPDWWRPVLFMRLRSGRIWFTPTPGQGFDKWGAVITAIAADPCRCTPILGPGVTEDLLGTRRELARELAEAHDFPLSRVARDDLPQVAQYLAVNLKRKNLRDLLQRRLRADLLLRLGDGAAGHEAASLPDLVSAVAGLDPETGGEDPHRILAGLPFPTYLTTNPANFMEAALKAHGVEPEAEVCRWRTDVRPRDWPPSVLHDEPAYKPSRDRPLVVHLFGSLDNEESVPVTEDDYFDYLIGISRRNALPDLVAKLLTNSSLLFIGFLLDDWEFRILLRTIMSKQGRRLLKDHPHVAVQVDPSDAQAVDVDAARRYLESYFQEDIPISTYWGPAKDFVLELNAAWDARRP